MSSNPYSDNDPQSPYAFQSQAPIGNGDGYIKQIPVVGILNIVQASMELMMCVMVIGIAIFMGGHGERPQIAEYTECTTHGMDRNRLLHFRSGDRSYRNAALSCRDHDFKKARSRLFDRSFGPWACDCIYLLLLSYLNCAVCIFAGCPNPTIRY